MQLNELKDKAGARKTGKRLGRGPASGKGTTAGRGMKGQKSRSGVALNGFEGGQMPIHMRIPKRGFNVPNPKKLNAVNLGRLQVAIDAGRLKKTALVNAQSLVEAGVIRRAKDGVRILGKGILKDKLDFDVAGVSAGARASIEKLGGKITIPTPAPTPGLAQDETPASTQSDAPKKQNKDK